MNKYRVPVFFYEVTPTKWDDAKIIGRRLEPCIFRGQPDKKFHLTTTIERAANRFNRLPEERWVRERKVLQDFKSRAHHYLQSPPNDNENIEWLSLIQDHGGPTRLLDFTESFYVASFFAVESTENDACVWAISRVDLNFAAFKEKNIGLKVNEDYPSNPEPILQFAESLIVDESKCFELVLCVIPPRLNECLAAQQGLFLFPCNLDKGFEYNLCKSFDLSFDALDSSNATYLKTEDAKSVPIKQVSIMKINLPKEIHHEALMDLHSMNINSATLFPGLDGFAKSLIYSIQMPLSSFIVISQVF